MKKTNRILSLVMSVVLVSFLFAGCESITFPWSNNDESALLESYRQEIESLNEELDSLAEQFQGLINENLDLADDNDLLESTVTLLNGQIAALSGQVEDLSEENTNLATVILDLEANINRLNAINEYLRGIISDLKNGTGFVYDYIVTFYVGEIIWDIQFLVSGEYADEPADPTLFDSWSLDGINAVDVTLVEIDSDTEFHAIVTVSVSFSEDSPDTISKISATGHADDFYNLGDEKIITINNFGTVTFVILGFNHDDKSDGSGKAGISLGMKDLLSTTYKMNETNTNINGWGGSYLRNSVLPDIFSQLPSDLQSVIKTVKKYSNTGGGTMEVPAVGVQRSDDKLFLFSRREVTSTSLYQGEGEIYEYWSTRTDADRIKYLSDGQGSANPWWLRSTSLYISSGFEYVSASGSCYPFPASALRGLCFGFCV